MIAIFDVDGTITGANSMSALVTALASEGAVSRGRVGALAMRLGLYRVGLLSFSNLMRRAYGLFEGLDVSRVETCAARVVRDVVAPAIYGEAVARIEWHRTRGDRVVLASAAPAMVVEQVGRHLGVNEIIATDFERVGGKIGRVKAPAAYGVGKVELARRADVLRQGASHVYTDHSEDWALVAAAGFTTLVNPGAAFVRQIRRRAVAHEIVRWGPARRQEAT